MQLSFDRGTIICTGAPRVCAVAKLPGVLWDRRVEVFRAPAYRYCELCAELKQRGVTYIDEVRIDGIRKPTTVSAALRPYQEAALQAWDLMGRRGVIALPTGSGKTNIAVAAIARSGYSTLCLVPTRILLEQWRGVLRELKNGTVGVYGDGERTLEHITVSTFESAYRHMPTIGNRFELLVVDEAHHFGTGIRDEALEMCTAAERLGLSATPPKRPEAQERLQRLIGPTVYELNIGDLTGSYLADFDLISLTLELNATERTAYEAEMALFRPLCRQFFRTHPMASWPDFVRALGSSDEGHRAFVAWRRAQQMLAYTEAKAGIVGTLLRRHRESKILVFTSNNETAYSISRRHLTMPLTCEITRRERQLALERFRTGELRALVSARVLNEGIDVPDADVAIIVGGSHGEREHVQRVGRLLRPRAGKRAAVYELVTRATQEIAQAEKRRRALGSRKGLALPSTG